MKADDEVYISPTKTANSWKLKRADLIAGDRECWEHVIRDYFSDRLYSRYLAPIETLERMSLSSGEGFAIVTIQCSLIEFLESCFQGKNYRFAKKCGKFEYSRSSEIFVSFLQNREPFNSEFSRKFAKSFYEGVRCGLLHEAATTDGWKIRLGSGERVLDKKNKIVFRDAFQIALLKYIEGYKELLLTCKTSQDAFIRKFDNIAANTVLKPYSLTVSAVREASRPGAVPLPAARATKPNDASRN